MFVFASHSQPRAFDEVAQRFVNANDHAVPIPCIVLPEQPGGWIPRAVISIEEPAPIGDVCHQYPNRLSQRTGEVGNAGIHGDHEIQMGYECRRIGKISKRVVEMENVVAFLKHRRIDGANILLQADKRCFDA